MRYVAVAIGSGLLGILAAVVAVAILVTGREPFNSWWLVSGIVLPVFGVVYGPLIYTYVHLSHGTPTAEGARRLPFVLVGTSLAALGYYACHVELASIHFGKDFWFLFANPTEAPEISTWGSNRIGRISQHLDTPLNALLIGSPLGALGTYALIRQVWD